MKNKNYHLLFIIGLTISLLLSCKNKSKESIEISSTSSPNIVLKKDSLPYIKGVSSNGETILLSDLKSNTILIDFWAAWCPDCRKAHPDLVKVYQKYHSKGLDIFSISLDEDKDDWKKIIEKDELTWKYHICDFKGWDSEYAKAYGVNEIPTNILYHNGKIVGTMMEPHQLDQVLSEILK